MSKRSAMSYKVVLVAVLAAGLMAASGCIVEVHEDDVLVGGPYYADLEVGWLVESSDDASWCDALYIDQWIVRINGPEVRDVVLDCSRNYWTSENDFLALEEGSYLITVKAVDFEGYELTTASTRINLIDNGDLQTVTIDFEEREFPLL